MLLEKYSRHQLFFLEDQEIFILGSWLLRYYTHLDIILLNEQGVLVFYFI